MGNYVIAFMVLISLNACKSGQNSNSDVNENGTKSDTGFVATRASCPEAGSCNVEMKEGMSFSMAEDGTGAMYPKYDKGNGVVVFTYTEKGPEGTADGDYSESIQFNIPTFGETLSLSNEDLKSVNLLFNKQCFCRGEAGFFPITNGTLDLSRNNKGVLQFKLTYDIKERTHKLNSISNM
jgi:hypothetical protein